MRAGPLRHRLSIQTATETRTDDGGVTLTWATVARRWGSVDGLSGREFQESGATQATATHMLRVRYYAGLTPRDRVLFGSRVFNVERVRQVREARRMTEITAREEV